MVVVTGATGHLGAVLVRQLIDAGERVRVVVRKQSVVAGLEGLDIDTRECSLFDTDGLVAAFRGASVVYHTAAMVEFGLGGRRALHHVNVEGTESVVAAVRAAGAGRLVYVGSIEAFPLARGPYPVTEEHGIDPDHTVMEYGRTKALATQRVLRAAEDGLDAVVVCPTGFLGPPDFRLSPTGQFVYDYARGRLPAYVDGGFDFVDVRDVAAGVIGAGAHGRSGECYLLSGEYHTLPEMVELLEQITGVPRPRICFPISLILPFMPLVELYYRVSGRQPRFTRNSLRIVSLGTTVDSSKAAEELGYRARPLSETLEDTVAWFRSRGMIPGRTPTREMV